MPQMTDPTSALESFQQVLLNDPMPLQPGALDPELFVHVDSPTGTPRFTYIRRCGSTVTALVIFAAVAPMKGHACFQLGYAVPPKYRSQGRAKEIVTAATAELKRGLTQNGVPEFYIEAVVGMDNKPSQGVAAATLSTKPDQITDELSGLPALHYVLKIEKDVVK